MPPPVKTRDLDDPDFPHGEERGYFRGCKRECCTWAHSVAGKRRAIAAAANRQSRVDAAPMQAHLDMLMASHPHVTIKAISTAADVDHRTIDSAYHRRYKRANRETVEKVLAVTPEQVAEHTFHVPGLRTQSLVRGMMAQGWSGLWLCERLGYSWEHRRAPIIAYNDHPVTRNFARRVEVLAAEVGNRTGPSTRTAARAKAQGWWPMAAYDDDGVLNLRLLPGHPWAEADDMCGRLLDDLAWWAEHPSATAYEVSQTMARDQIEVTRLSDRLKRHHGARWHEALVAAVQAYEDGADGTYEALSVGLVVTGNVASTQVPKDHPVVARIAEERAAPRAAEAS